MTRTLKPVCLLIGGMLVGCGGGDASSETEQPTVEATPAASSASLDGCYVQGTMEEAMARTSPLRELGFVYGGGAGLLCYGAPSARGRGVMNSQVVPYDQLWRFGANEATAIHLTAPATLGGVALEPGSYSLYALPAEGQWQIFVNSSFERWGIPITDEVRATEVGSFTAVAEASDEMVETLTFSYEGNDAGTGGDLIMAWENTRVRLPLDAG